MKKLLITFCSLALLVIVFVAFRVGINFSGGRYLGYSPETSEWLLFEYQNIPVQNDGPYVFNKNGSLYGIYIDGNGEIPAKAHQKNITDKVNVIVDNDLSTQFIVPLRNNYPRSLLGFPAPKKLLAISDIEGEFDAMTDLLHANSVIDKSLNWSYGSGHVVLIGDMVDRGTNVVPLLWLIYKLETEAQLVGGKVHYILGNHERYLLDGRVKAAAKKYQGTFRATGMSQRELWSENSELGRWLRSKPVMLKIGDTLFLHGGMSPEVLSTKPTLQSIDGEAQKNFVIGDTIRRTIKNSIIHDPSGILFYRGFAKDGGSEGLGGKADNAHVDQVLKEFNVDRVAVGHTLAKHVGYDYDGKVIRVDVNHSSGLSEALLIENNLLWRVNNEGEKFHLKQAENLSDS